jgi:hypothetical protein
MDEHDRDIGFGVTADLRVEAGAVPGQDGRRAGRRRRERFRPGTPRTHREAGHRQTDGEHDEAAGRGGHPRPLPRR